MYSMLIVKTLVLLCPTLKSEYFSILPTIQNQSIAQGQIKSQMSQTREKKDVQYM